MRKPSFLMVSVATAAVLGAGVLTGCGGAKSPASPAPSPASAAASAPASSAPATSQATTQPPANDQPGPVDNQEFARRIADALKDVKTYAIDGKSTVTVDGQTVASSMTMTFDISDRTNIKLHQVMESPTGTSELITIGNTTWIRSGGQTMWTRTTELLNDPTASAADLSTVKGALEGSTVQFVGSEVEQASGRQLRHYTITTADGKVTNYFLDSNDRPVLMTLDQDSVSMELRFGKFNEPVNIQAPPDSEVVAG